MIIVPPLRLKPLPPRRHFVLRMLRSMLLFVGFIGLSLGIGAVGYHAYGKMHWLDATLSAAMILTGMGPKGEMETAGGKRFEIGYAIYSGVAFLSSVAVLLGPVVHRFLHRFHLDALEDAPSPGRDGD
ncbi:MAG TPA: hypothetical protein VGO40_13060 [Longimicrobium sp.]|jgi:hypothetical protein|nr:hypothetical protein [Longimicrobium sp.]